MLAHLRRIIANKRVTKKGGFGAFLLTVISVGTLYFLLTHETKTILLCDGTTTDSRQKPDSPVTEEKYFFDQEKVRLYESALSVRLGSYPWEKCDSDDEEIRCQSSSDLSLPSRQELTSKGETLWYSESLDLQTLEYNEQWRQIEKDGVFYKSYKRGKCRIATNLLD